MDLRLELFDGFHLAGVRAGDEEAFVAHLGDGEIARVIPVLPFPYGLEQASFWVRHREAFRARMGAETTFGIRDRDGYLLGSVGVDDYAVGEVDHAELGCWLSPSARGRGLATAAVDAFVRHAFSTLGLSLLSARTLSSNRASARVLEKAGFRLSGEKPEFTETREGRFDTVFYEFARANPV